MRPLANQARPPVGIETNEDGYRKISTVTLCRLDTFACLRITRRGKGSRWSEYQHLNREQLVAHVNDCQDVLRVLPSEDAR